MPKWLWTWQNKWSKCIVCIPRQKITLKTSAIGTVSVQSSGSQTQTSRHPREPKISEVASFRPIMHPVNGGSTYSSVTRLCVHCGQMDFSRETGNLDVCLNTPDCKIFVYKIHKNNFFKHFEGQTKCNTSAGWTWHTHHQDVASALSSSLACASGDFYGSL